MKAPQGFIGHLCVNLKFLLDEIMMDDIRDMLVHRAWQQRIGLIWVVATSALALCGCHLPLTSETATSVWPQQTPTPIAEQNRAVDWHQQGCLSCHQQIESRTMHANPAVQITCTGCHGGDSTIAATGETCAQTRNPLAAHAEYCRDRKTRAHNVRPRHPAAWQIGTDVDSSHAGANPVRSYTLLNEEDPAYIRFVNPGDLRVVGETCGICHATEVHQVQTSVMTTSSVFWAAAAYNNGIWPDKHAIFGESYSRDGVAQKIIAQAPHDLGKGELPFLLPLPRWEVLPPGDNFRVFEDGGFLIPSLFPDVGNPNPFEEGGKPDIRQSVRGLGTGLRISVPVLNLHKTRLNDPHLSFMGTNDHPSDYRSSGCTSCHVVYANDRDPYHAGPYAKHGHLGQGATDDQAFSKEQKAVSGHPIRHVLTRSIPTSQCIVCHMHQPNSFLNTYLGYTGSIR